MDKQKYLVLVNDIAKWAVENTGNTSERENLLRRLWNSIELLYPEGGEGEIEEEKK